MLLEPTPKPTLKHKLLRLLPIMITIIGVIGLGIILVLTAMAKNTGFENKTLWDWMELLIIPFVLALGAFTLNRSERKTEREIATDRQQEAALQSYIDRMADLLLKDELRKNANEEVRNVARMRTLTLLRGLDAKRKGMVLHFLYESGLIQKGNDEESTIIDLRTADLREADIGDVDLMNAALWDADLSGAYLGGAFMHGSNFIVANLSRAYLVKASLVEAELHEANLRRANLTNAYIVKADLSIADLSEANLTGANLGEANLVEANLTKADLLEPS